MDLRRGRQPTAILANVYGPLLQFILFYKNRHYVLKPRTKVYGLETVC